MSRGSFVLALILLVGALVVGAAINVYVVYRLTLTAEGKLEPESMPSWSHGPGTTAWYWRELRAPGIHRIDGLGTSQRVADGQRSADRALPPGWTTMTESPSDIEIGVERQERAVGWPFLSLSSSIERAQANSQRVARAPTWSVVYGTEITNNNPQRRMVATMTGQVDVMPTKPIWGGFIVNSALFALPVWLVFLLFAVIIAFGPRRWWRRRRGRCVRCAYDLRHDFARGCPECGWNRTAAPTTAP